MTPDASSALHAQRTSFAAACAVRRGAVGRTMADEVREAIRRNLQASKVGLEIFSSGALAYARNWWKSSNALPIKNAAGLSKKRKAEAA